jgi:hypothetical protein
MVGHKVKEIYAFMVVVMMQKMRKQEGKVYNIVQQIAW